MIDSRYIKAISQMYKGYDNIRKKKEATPLETERRDLIGPVK